jgi:hypothetical protein
MMLPNITLFQGKCDKLSHSASQDQTPPYEYRRELMFV